LEVVFILVVGCWLLVVSIIKDLNKKKTSTV
jgi:hypothetical protein